MTSVKERGLAEKVSPYSSDLTREKATSLIRVHAEKKYNRFSSEFIDCLIRVIPERFFCQPVIYLAVEASLISTIDIPDDVSEAEVAQAVWEQIAQELYSEFIHLRSTFAKILFPFFAAGWIDGSRNAFMLLDPGQSPVDFLLESDWVNRPEESIAATWEELVENKVLLPAATEVGRHSWRLNPVAFEAFKDVVNFDHWREDDWLPCVEQRLKMNNRQE